jgi:hypothetical protein
MRAKPWPKRDSEFELVSASFDLVWIRDRMRLELDEFFMFVQSCPLYDSLVN